MAIFSNLGERPVRREDELGRRGRLLAEGLRQVGGHDFRALGDQDRAFDGVLQFAHVAGPPVPNQHVVRGRREPPHRLLVALAELLEEVLAQQRDVLGTHPERRHLQRDGVDAEVEVLAQLAFAQRHVEIDVRRTDETEVDVHDAVAADRPVLALLQHAEQLGLQVGRHLADLVEQQGAALGHFEQPFLVHRRAGERPLLVAEQLRLDQVLGDGRTVDLDERGLGTLAVVVDRVGDELLAGPVFAFDEDVRVAAGDVLDELEQILHPLALADDVRELELVLELLFQLQVLGLQVLPLNRLPEQGQDPVGFDRLLEEVGGARLDRIHRLRNRAVAGDDDHFDVGLQLLEPLEQVESVHVRQHHIGDYRIRSPGLEDLVAPRTNEGRPHLVALMLEQDLQPLGHRRLVVNHEHALLAFGRHGQALPLVREHLALPYSKSIHAGPSMSRS